MADSPYIHPCFKLSTTVTSLQWPFFWRTVHTFTLVSNSLQRPPLYGGHFFFSGQSIHSPLFQPLYNGHLSTTAIFFGGQSIHSLLFQPFYNGHLCTTAIFFGGQSVHSPLFQTLYNGHLSTTAIFFGRQSIHSLLFQPLYIVQRLSLRNGHFPLSPSWPLWRVSTVV